MHAKKRWTDKKKFTSVLVSFILNPENLKSREFDLILLLVAWFALMFFFSRCELGHVRLVAKGKTFSGVGMLSMTSLIAIKKRATWWTWPFWNSIGESAFVLLWRRLNWPGCDILGKRMLVYVTKTFSGELVKFYVFLYCLVNFLFVHGYYHGFFFQFLFPFVYFSLSILLTIFYFRFFFSFSISIRIFFVFYSIVYFLFPIFHFLFSIYYFPFPIFHFLFSIFYFLFPIFHVLLFITNFPFPIFHVLFSIFCRPFPIFHFSIPIPFHFWSNQYFPPTCLSYLLNLIPIEMFITIKVPDNYKMLRELLREFYLLINIQILAVQRLYVEYRYFFSRSC